MGGIIAMPIWYTSAKHWREELPLRYTKQEWRKCCNDHDDDDLDYDGGDESYDEEDDCSVVEAAAVRIRPVQEYSSDDNYGPYWDNSPTSMPYLDHVSD